VNTGDEGLGYRVDHRPRLRNDDELGLRIARLDLTSSSDVGVDVVDFVDVADDPDLWFVLEEAVDEPLRSGFRKSLSSIPAGDAEVLILRLLISTVLPKARKETELIGIQGERHSMKERYLVCLSGGSDVASRAGICTQIEDMNELARPLLAAPRPFRAQ